MKITHFILAFIIFGLCASCDTVVELDVPREESRLVVNSFFGPDTTFAMLLSQSEFILDEQDFEAISGASATILDEDGDTLGTLEEQEPGFYTSNIKPQPGETYRLEVSKRGYETVRAENQIPADSARINNIEIRRFDDHSTALRLSIWIDDPPGSDYYELYGLSKTVLYNESDTLRSTDNLHFNTDDPIFGDFDRDNEVVRGSYLLFDDALFDGNTRKITLTTSFRYSSCSPSSECEAETDVTLYLRKTSEAYYRYKETSKLQDDLSANPFAEPVPVFNNIENGFGIFAGYNVSAYPLEVPESQ